MGPKKQNPLEGIKMTGEKNDWGLSVPANCMQNGKAKTQRPIAKEMVGQVTARLRAL